MKWPFCVAIVQIERYWISFVAIHFLYASNFLETFNVHPEALLYVLIILFVFDGAAVRLLNVQLFSTHNTTKIVGISMLGIYTSKNL